MIEKYNTEMLFDDYSRRANAGHRVILPEKIGVMADSHGNITSIARCLNCFLERRAEKIFHLGDVFDSEIYDDLMPIVDMIRRHDIHAVKGNNDLQIEKIIENGNSINLEACDRESLMQFLKSMARLFISDAFCFAHSLPFDSIRSVYEPIDNGDTDRAAWIFNHTDHHVLFSGHSHVPLLFRWQNGTVTREPLPENRPLLFEQGQRYIVIVGSSDKGECGFLDGKKMLYERIRC